MSKHKKCLKVDGENIKLNCEVIRSTTAWEFSRRPHCFDSIIPPKRSIFKSKQGSNAMKRGCKLLVFLQEKDTPLLTFPFQQEGQSSAAPQERKLCIFCCTCLLLSVRGMSGAGKSSIAGLGFAEVF